jgi:hypothetical protein
MVAVIPSHFAELLDYLPDVLAWVKHDYVAMVITVASTILTTSCK